MNHAMLDSRNVQLLHPISELHRSSPEMVMAGRRPFTMRLDALLEIATGA